MHMNITLEIHEKLFSHHSCSSRDRAEWKSNGRFRASYGPFLWTLHTLGCSILVKIVTALFLAKFIDTIKWLCVSKAVTDMVDLVYTDPRIQPYSTHEIRLTSLVILFWMSGRFHFTWRSSCWTTARFRNSKSVRPYLNQKHPHALTRNRTMLDILRSIYKANRATLPLPEKYIVFLDRCLFLVEECTNTMERGKWVKEPAYSVSSQGPIHLLNLLSLRILHFQT